MRKALTWQATSYDPDLGITRVGTAGGNAYVGDTPVTASLPVLAIKVDGSPRPPYETPGRAHAMPKEFYSGWAEGRVALTPPIAGVELTSREKADAYCREHCGPGYRMAEFHDGRWVPGMGKDRYHGSTWPRGRASTGGWNFFAYGKIPLGQRFWVCISNQPANPWSR